MHSHSPQVLWVDHPTVEVTPGAHFVPVAANIQQQQQQQQQAPSSPPPSQTGPPSPRMSVSSDSIMGSFATTPHSVASPYNHAGEMSWVKVSTSGHIIGASTNIQRIFANPYSRNGPSCTTGGAKDEFIGTPIVGYVHEQDIQEFINAISSIFSELCTVQMKYRLKCPDGILVCQGRGVPSQGSLILECDSCQYETNQSGNSKYQSLWSRRRASKSEQAPTETQSQSQAQQQQPSSPSSPLTHVQNSAYVLAPSPQILSSCQPRQHRNQALNVYLQSPLDMGLDPLDHEVSDHSSPGQSSSARSSVSVSTNSSAASSTSSLLAGVASPVSPPMAQKQQPPTHIAVDLSPSTPVQPTQPRPPTSASVSVSVAQLSLCSPFSSSVGSPQPTLTMEDMQDVKQWGNLSPYTQSIYSFENNTSPSAVNTTGAASSPLDEYYYYCYPPTQSPSFGSYWDNTTNNELISLNFDCPDPTGVASNFSFPSPRNTATTASAKHHQHTHVKHQPPAKLTSTFQTRICHHNPAPYNVTKRSSVSSQSGNTSINIAPVKARRRSRVGGDDDQSYLCDECGTRESPEWRKGPNGPKTLCNACGLRWAKWSKKKSVDCGRK